MPKQGNVITVAAEAAEEKKAPSPVAEEKQKYTVEKLRLYCVKLFGITTSTFDGAMYGHTGTYTVDEAREIINNWLKGGK